MRFLSQRYADLTGCRIGNFYVDSILGRNSKKGGVPIWRLACSKCSYPLQLGHHQVQAMIQAGPSAKFPCANNACVLSRMEHTSETLADIRRAERIEAERAAEARRAAEAEAAKQRARDDRLAALKTEYRRFWNHQVQTPIALDKIVSLARWCQLADGTRKMILDRITKDPTVRFEGL